MEGVHGLAQSRQPVQDEFVLRHDERVLLPQRAQVAVDVVLAFNDGVEPGFAGLLRAVQGRVQLQLDDFQVLALGVADGFDARVQSGRVPAEQERHGEGGLHGLRLLAGLSVGGPHGFAAQVRVADEAFVLAMVS